MRAMTLCMAALVLACGEGADPIAQEAAMAQAVLPEQPAVVEERPSLALAHSEPLALAPQSLAVPQDEAPFNLTLSGSGFTAADGVTIKAAVAVMGCGYWVTGMGSAQVQQGSFWLSVPDSLMSSYGQTVFLFEDADADGLCDVAQGDRVWQLEVDGGAPQSLSVTEADLTPTHGWECVLFEEVP